MRFWPGETVRADIAFTDGAGAPVAATGVAVVWRRIGDAPVEVPGGQIIPGGVGEFRVDLVAALPGEYAVRATCTGPSPAVVEAGFTVVQGAFLP